MNYRDKIQKFSIRKYTVGTFSTVIATLVFLGFNTSQAHAAETNQPASVVKQKQQSNNEQTENRESQVQNSQNSQNSQSLSATHENEQPNNSQANLVNQKVAQSSTTNDEQPASQNVNTKKDSATAATTQPDKEESKHKQNESQSANKNGNDNRAAHVENHEANVVTASDSSDNGNVQHDRNELQAFFDANYHDYRFIDRENADSGTFNYVKGIFDKINTLLGSNDPINNKDLQLAYKELEQAVALIRTMPQRQQTSRRSNRIQTRSVESRAAEPRSVSDYQNANSSYYVENANDGSGYPVGTYINASSKGAPYNLPTTPWNTLKASDSKEIALMTAKQTGDGYQWVIKFNKGHAPHQNMIFWFALPADQVPVGRTDFVTVNSDGTNVQWSHGAGAGANKPLQQMWEYGVNDPDRSHDFKIRNRSGQVIYSWPTVHVYSLEDLSRASDYFSEAGATPATKAFGRQNFEYINGQKPAESPGVPKVYTFIGQGDASYTISFKTQGPTVNKLYYAAGGRALEYNQLFMYSQLYVESTQDHQQRLNGLRQVVNRTYRIGTTKRVEVSQGNVQTKKVLESTNLNIDDFVDDPLSYVKTPSNKVLGFYPTNANTNAFRPGGVQELNEYQLSQLFTDQKLQEAARTRNPIRLMIGFDYPDCYGNSETLVPVNLTVLPEIQHNIKFFKNDDTQNIAEKPFSKQAGHPVFYVYAGNQGNASVNLGGSVTSIQPLRINLTSNENFTDKDWQITGIPRTLHIENSTNRTNNARERNIELVGNLLPGDYFGTIRFGRKEQLFEIRVKPHTPTITTTAEQLRGTALQKVPVNISGIPLDPSALVYLVAPTNQTTNGGSEADQIPSGYTILATGTPDGVHNTITIRPQDYVVFIPPVGKQIRAVVYYNKVVASNMSNAVTILPDDIPPTINNPVGINAKYYRGDEVNFTMGVSDRHSGIKNTTITTLPSGWTSNLTKSDNKNGSLAITGRVSMNQAFNSDITFKVSATDNVNNTTNDSQSKHVSIHVGKISEDAHPIVLGNTEKVVVVNPTAVSNDEKQSIITAFMNKNQNIRGYLASTDPVTVDNNGNVTLHYRDGSSTTLDATNVMTYEPVVKSEYQTANAAKTATVTIAKGQSFNIGDIKQYFTLSNGQAIPNGTFTNITSDRTIPTAQEVSQMNAGTQLYHIVASNAYHKDTEDFYISLKIVDVKQPEGDQRVYRTSTYDLTTDEISKVKQAFINANRDVITLAEGDISVTNTPNGANVSTITVNINKGRLTKSFASNLANMNFLRWVNFPQDYTVTWTNAKIANRPTDGGLSWSDDHKSLIYRYDATLGTQITTNDILTMLKATTTVPGLRNNITGNEKAQAEAGGRPNYRTTGYSQSNATTDGQRQFTLNGQVIQILDIINPSNGYGGQPVTNSNTRANHSNSTVVNVNEPAANGAGAFTIDHVVKSNSTHNASDAVYKAQLYLTPYGPKQYVEHLNQNTGNTTDAINIYFVPSDLVNPTISVGNYTNHQVFSGETFTNTITANDNFGVQSLTVPNTSQITGTVDNNHQHVSATAPNVTSATSKTINLLATDTSGNTATTSFNVTVKPLRDKYRVGTSSTAANPVRIANISNNATVSQADQTTIINSLTFTSNAPNRNYATASANEITSKTVSNVSRTGNNANVTVTVTHQDGTTSTVTVPVKHVIPEIVAHSHYTVQGQDFPAGNGSSAADYFKLSNGSAIPDATITWVSGQAPNKDNTRIGEDITVTAHILIDGETTPITKTATYKVVRTVPKHVFETARGVLYPGVSDMYDAKQYVKPVNNSWSTNAQHMNFQFVGTYGPNKDVVGISTRLIRVTYDNRQTEDLTILSKVKPDPPRIDANSVTYKAGLTNQEIKVNNVLNNSSVKLFKADNTPLNVTNITHGSGFSSVVTVSDALPNGGIKAKSSISMNNVTYTTQDEHGQVVTVTRNESVDSNDSASVTVTPQLQATTEGAVFIKGGDGFDFGHVERFIQNPPHGATVAWHDSPDTWKNTVGNTHKTAVVTLPSGQGTRNVEVPVKVYPVANAKAPSRDVKGQNLTHGTNAIDYITFDPNTNTNGITAAWANRQQPNNQQAGVQHLNVDVTYPGISAAKRVPVTVNVYQFEFPQTTYTTTVGGTLASGTQASGYAHMQNASGLPTDGFTYKWNRDTTGTNDANWAAMNKPNTAQVVNAKYDVIYNGHTFATSLPAKFVVKDVQPAKPTVTETAAGAITIAPGANQTVNTHAGNVTTYADKLVIKRNGNVVTTFTRRNNTSPWVKEASADNVTGIVGTNNGITVAAGTFNPADTIQVVATQGSGETISDEQRSDDFTVVAPQPNQATTKIWQNGHIDITPNNPSGHLINPTQAMDIAYTEKVGNGAEHSKTINVVRGQNNQWTIANKPDYVTLDAQTGKVTFNANTIKPNSSITITPKAGTGHSVSSNPSTLTAPAAHTVNTTEIVKDYGSNVTAAEINNAVQVANKRTATIKNGTAMPTNLAGGSTTTIPVTVTYNDGSTEEVQESIFTKADKRELITAKNHLDDPVSTEGKKPGTITQYNNAMHNAQQQINTAKTEAQQVINNERATPQQVSDALTKVRAAQTKIDQAKALLQNKEDNSQLVTSKNNLQSSVNQVPSTAGMTQQSIDNYNAKKREAETEITAAQRVIDNGDATAQQISDEKHRVDNALTALNQAKHDLTADTHALEQAVQQLNRTGTTTGKKPASITAYNNSIRALQSDLTSAKNSANAIIQKPIRTVQEVQSALTNVNRVNERLTQAINQLVPLADNSALRTAKTKLDEEINKSVTTDGMTQSSIQAYENAKRAGQTETTNAQNVINNGDATDQQIAAEKTKVEEKYNSLKQAIAGLTPDLAPLQTAKTQLQNDIDQPTSTTGMTSASVAAFNDKLSAARTKIQEIDRVLASHPDVATIRQNVTAANAAKTALDQARNGLTVDKAPLENAKNQLQHSIDTQTSTTGMTQDSINAYNAKLTAARNKVQQINQVLAGSPTVDQINTNTSAANQAKSDLDHARQALTPDKAPLQNAKTQLEQSINQPTDTTGMTTASLNAYNQKLQAARQKLTEINQVLNGNPTVQNINDKVAEANQAKDQLNTARQGLTLDRQPALTTLHGASNLNQAQQNNFTQQINAAQNHAALETIKSNITALNTAMTKLKDSVADNNTIKSGQNYTDATPANKQAYDNAVNAAKGVIGETTNPTMDVNTVNQKAASVKSTKDALDGQQNLQRAKTEATNAITHASDLNQAQKNALTQQVNSAQNVQAVNDIKQTTQSLNTAMTGLKRGVANHNQVVQSDNYVNADTNKKNDYNNAYNHANDIINGNAQHPVITPSDVNNALSNVTSKEHALNGEAKLNAAKQEANTALGHLNNLNNVQRQNLQSQINGAHQIDAVNTIKQNATNLNSAMGNLKQAIADKDATKATVNFTDADQAKQQAYNTAVTNAENIISKANGGNATQTEVEQAIQQVNAAKQALNGNANVQHAKDEATALINNSNDLNQAQKDALKQQVQNATTVAGVNNVKQTAQELNNAMTQLKQGIADKEQTKADGNFVNADSDKQNAYNQAVAKAEALISGTPDVVVTPSEITAALNKVTQAKNDLNGNTNLATAKQNVQHAIDQLPNLNQAQRDEYSKQITQATLVPNVNAIQQAATTLNDAMTQLKQGIANKAQIKGSENYHDADTDKQTAYDNAVTKAEELLKQTTNPTMDPNTIQQALTKVNDTNQALNGNQKLADAKQDAKTTLGTLDHLNDAQKQALTTQVEQAPDIATVNNVKQNAQNLNNAMTNLNNALQDKTETLNSINFTDADQAKKDDYTNAVSHAEGILSKANGSNASQTEVEQAMQRVNEAKQALNGNDNVQRAKDAAKQVITNANDLNQAQKDALKQQVDAAQTVANVNTIKQTAQDLNQAMTQLKQGIADKDQTKANGNFVNADTDKQNAYNNAVAHAEQIISGTPNANVDPQQVAQALQQVNQAKGDLNGNHNLQVAKDNANTAIDQLPNLNQPQKTALKDQVSHAELVTGVNAIKQNADALNNAMGTLKQQIQANSQVPQSVDFTQADQDKQQAYNNAANQAQQIANGTPTPVLAPDTVTKAVTTMNQAKDALNGDEKLAQAKQDALANLDTLRDLNQPQRDALRNQINQAQALATVEQTKQNAQNVNTAMGNLKQGIANKDTVKASENYHDADVDKQTAYTNAVSQAEGIINQTTNPTLNPDDITRALTQVTDAKNSLNGEAKLATEKQNAKDAVSGMTHLNDAQKQALKGQIDQSPEIATVNQVKQTATSLDQAMDQLSQAINDKDQILADGNYLNADPDKQNAYKQAVAKAEALLNKQSGTNEVQAQVESITNEVNAAKQALNGNDNLANAKQQAKQQLANLTHLNDAQKQSFESQITQAPLVTDVTTINQKAQTLDHAMELLRNSVADNQTTLASEDYHDATAQRQNDYNKAVTAANNIINQTTSPTMNPDDVNGATTQVNNTKVALDGDENLAAAKQQANNRLDQLDHLNNAQKQQLQSQITQSSDIAAVNGHKQTAESLNTAMGNLINAIADHQAVEQRGNFINADTDKQTAYNTAVNEAAAMINKQTGQNANQTEVEQAITKVQTTLQALNGDHNLQVAKTNATQAIDVLTSLNDPQKTALKDQVTAATLVTAVHQIEQNANTLNQAMHGLRQSIQDNAATKANSKYINEDQPEQQNYDQAVQAANNIINEQTATLDNNAINQVAATVNTTKAALHGDVKLQNDKDHAKQTVSQLAHLNNAQKHMEDTLIDSETTRTAVKQDLTEVQALDQLMDALQQSIADKDATRASSAYVNAEPNKKQAYDEAVQNAESIIAGLNNPTINKGNVSSATQAVISSKNALDGVERLAQDKQTAGNSLNHLDQLTPAQQQALENQINNATTRDKVAEIIAQAQALNEAMKALKESIKDQPQTEASSKFINEDQAQKDAYTQAVQHAKDLINKTTDPTLAKSIIDQATQAVTDAKNNLHGDQKLAQDKQRATETLNNLSNLNTPQRQALENQINNAATRGEVAQKLTEAQALNQAMEALRNSIQDQQQTESGSKFINEDKPQKDAYQAAVQNAKDLINQTGNPTLDKAQVEQLTHAFKQAKDNLHGDQKLADDKQHAVTDLNQLNGLNNPQRQALESQINNAATRGEVAQKLAEAKALDQAMQALRNSIQDQQQTEAGSKFINEDKPQKDAYQAAVQNAKDLINQTGNPTLDKSQVEQLTQAVTTAKDNLHGDQKLARDQQQAVTTVNALPNLNHAQQQTLTDAINAAPTRTEVAQHVQTATELDHAMETLKNKVDQVNTDKAQPNYTEASTDKKEAVDQALQAAQSITDPTNGSNANKDAVEQALTKLQEKVNELNGNERVAEAKTQAKQTIDQLTHLNADQIATAKQNIDQATKLQPIAELVDQATQLNQSMDQLQQAVNEHANVEQTIDYTQADSDKQKAYKQAIADAENVLKQNANKQQVDQALQNILNAKQALNGDERVALAKTNGKHDIDQLNALNNAQQDGFKGRIDQSNDLNQIQQIVDEAKALNRAMDQLSQEITGNEGRTKGSTNYVNADTQVKQVYDEAVDKAKQALDKSSGQNLTAEQVIKLNDAVTAAKKALNGEERLNNRKAEALQRLDQLTHLNNAQRQLAIQQINNAETLNKASRAINRATKLDNAMGAVQQYIDEQHLGVISSTNYINADDNLKANYDNAIANAAHELDKVQGNAIAKAEAEQLKQNIIDAQNALNGDQNLANAKDKANAFVNSLNGLNQQQQDLAHKAINNADTVSDVTDIVNNQIDLNDAMETLKHLVDNEIPNAEQTVNYQNADDNAKTNFDDAKRLANTLLNSDNTNVNDINGAIQAVNDAIHNLNGDQRLQDAKDKAIQSINQALANKLKEIEASNATDQDKLIAKNKAEELANSIINNINKATSNQAVSQVQTAGNHAIEQVHANEIPKAKIDANKDVDKQVQALIDEIDRNPNLTDKEKQALKDRINQILQQGHNDINNALTKEEIEQAKAQLAQALQDIKDLVKAKEDAKQDVDKQVQALIDEIDQNPNLTDKEKQALKDRINQILQQGHNGINNAMTKEEIEQAKAQLAQALKEIKDLVKAKENAKQDVDKQVQALIDEIDQNPNLTDKEKQALKDRINQILQQGHNDINNAMTKEEIEQAKAQLAQALQDIKDLVKAKEDAKNAIKALANAKRDQINSNPDLTPEQKAKALKEIDEAEKRALQNVENAQTIDQLNRGLNLGLDDIRNTHVWEVDEQPAVNEIFEATPEQILVNGELIVHRDDIITEQDILAHINLIDQLSAEVIDTPSTATISDSLTAKVEVTLLDGSKVIVNVPVKVVEKELSVVKQQAIESIENAAQQKIDEINNSVTLTLEQKEAAIAEVNKLKQQAIDHVNNAPDVHSVEEIQQQEQAYIEQFNPEQFTIEQAKSNAIKSIEDAIQHMIDEIKARTDLTDKEKQEAIAKLNQLKEQAIQAIQRAQSISEITEQLEQFKAQMKAANPTAKELAKRKQEAISRIKDFSNEKINSIRNSEIGTADEKQAAMNQINEIVLETIRDINNAHTLQQVEAALNNGIARISAVQIVISDRAKQSSSTGNESNSHLTIGYGTANHPFNSSTIGHKKKLDEDDDIDPLHMRHFSNNFGNVIKNAIGVVGISGLLASFWFFIAKRRRKEDEEEELEIRDNNKDSIKETLDDTKHLPLLFAKRRRKEDEEDVTVEEKDSLNNGESLDKVKHTPFFLPKRRRKEDEEDVEVTNENTDEKVLKDNEHSPLLFAKRRKDKEEDVETTTSIESKDEDVPLLLAKKKNQKDNQSKDKKSASKNTSKKVAAKKKKKKSKKNKK
ncbi:TPA: hyperosmolarity resistance protein Ebh [Staphylococcus aureus]|nr:hyperosmolarity resistance protein Ebh [Staphylococcus aureus]HCV8451087.1 hyperosmolarity resistance protein Ebh [Staphylococcus aureus]HCV9388918.1 hyperosmolarity resistance protein Ebh [Staphylococcus aureus]